MRLLLCTFAMALFNIMAVLGQIETQTDQIIVKLKNSDYSGDMTLLNQSIVGLDKIEEIAHNFNAQKIYKLKTSMKNIQHIFTIKFPRETNIHEVIEEFYKTGNVEYAEPDYIGIGGGLQGVKPNDQNYHRQWGLKNDGTFSLSPSVADADIDIENAWTIEQGDSNVIVTIIDSGNRLNHPEFEGRIWINHDEIPNNGLDDDKNGYVDDVLGWDFANNDNDPTDDLGHGTNVAGIIGANGNNNIGYAGVDWECKLMILKGLNNNNYGYYSWWVEAMYYAINNGADVINLSLGGLTLSAALYDVVNYALGNNVVIVACMMNNNSNTVFYPAGFNGVIAVGSTNPDDTRSSPFFWDPQSGSTYGNHISVVAPGNFIYGLSHLSDTNYNSYWGGTSQAAPLVSGLAALLIAQNPNRSPAEIKSIIEMSSDDQVGNPSEDTPGWDQYYGHGRVNAFAALSGLTSVRSIDMSETDFMLYPNPADKRFTVKFPANAEQIQIFNTLGQTIHTKNINGYTEQEFQLQDNGIYLIQIIAADRTYHKKLIIN